METLNYGWKFLKSEQEDLYSPELNDSLWREVRVPHDYAIEGPFAEENDSQLVGVIADGLPNPISHIGRTGSLPINDKAWYRKTIIINKDTKRAFLEFDGVMCNSKIYLNGKYVGGRPYGYISFCLEITDYMHKGENILAVQCNPEPCASRWYTGAGIYRNVRLRQTDEICFDFFANKVTYVLNNNNVNITNSMNISNPNNREITVTTEIFNKENKLVASHSDNKFEHNLNLNDIILWSLDNPYLYTIKMKITKDKKVIDEKVISFGFRKIELIENKGFLLNGKIIKFKGVCMHHDFGALGTAVNVYALRRQLDILKSFGTNAIRTSHNPCTPELLDMCDEMGFLVMDEAFDEWEITKVINGYAKHFKDWSQQDLEDLVKRDFNHPCVVMWSIGNEILEQAKKNGGLVADRLVDIVRNIDTSRFVTCGFNDPLGAILHKLDNKLDIIGLNYQPSRYKFFKKLRPNKFLIGSETSSCLSSRGDYNGKAKPNIPAKTRDDLLLSSYDLSAPGWGCTPDFEFYYQDKCEYILGEFVWTGFDYIGEPTPYYSNFPCRSSYFGIVDLAGMPKDRYYSYKAKWNTDEDTIHLFPHWNWNENQKVDIHCYCSDERVELFLNGKSLGVKSKKNKKTKNHRLVWKKVKFEKGILEAVSCTNPNLKTSICTTQEPYALRLTPEQTTLIADGDSLAYVRCDVVDKNGNIVPTANNRVEITVNGQGEYLASDNGKQCEARTFSQPYCDAFNGSLIIIARTIKGKVGNIEINATSNSLVSAKTIIEIR